MGGSNAAGRSAHVAGLQRKRRAGLVRIDYMPSPEAVAVLEARRATRPRNSVAATNSAVINAIVSEWAELVALPVSPTRTRREGMPARMPLKPDAGSITEPDRPQGQRKAQRGRAGQRVICGATRHRDRKPCQAKSEPGKQRCRFHGGRSTGPRTPEGKARCTANLPNRRIKGDAGG